MNQGVKESIKRKLAGALAAFFMLATVLEYGPILSLAGENANGQVVAGLIATRQEDDVILSWKYGAPPASPYQAEKYEVLLKTADGKFEILGENTQLTDLVNNKTIQNARKTQEVYTIEVYCTYSIPKPDVTGTDVTGGDTTGGDATGGDATGGNASVTYVQSRELIGSASIAWTPEYKVTFQAGANGSIKYGNQTYTHTSGEVYIEQNSNQTFTISPSNRYEIDTFTAPAGVTETGEGTYSLAGITEDATIQVTFSRILNPPALNIGSELSTDKQNPTVLDKDAKITFLAPEAETAIYYHNADAAAGQTASDNWILYQQGIELKPSYDTGVLKAKVIGKNAKESQVMTWYYTTLPALPQNPVFQLSKAGSGQSTDLTKNNWVKETDDSSIKALNLPQDTDSGAGTYQYMLYLKPAEGEAVCTPLTWSLQEGAYIYDLGAGLPNGVYRVGYTVRNAAGIEQPVQYTPSYLAYDNGIPEISFEERSNHLVEKEGEAGSYYTNSDLQFKLSVLQPAPVSQVAFYSYKIDGQNWTQVTGDSVSIPLTEIEKNTQIFFRATTNSGMTQEVSLYVTKDITPPGGEDGTVLAELTAVMQEAVLYDKNPADGTCESVDTNVQNAIYYQPSEQVEIVLSGVSEREADSQSKLYVRYKVEKFGADFSKDGAETLLPAGGELKLEFAKNDMLKRQGKYSIYIWTEDEAGNCSQPIQRTVCYDNTKPTILKPGFTSGAFTSGSYDSNNNHYENFANGSVEASFKVLESEAGISKIEYYNIESGQEQLIYCDTKNAGSTMDGTQPIHYSLTQSAQYKLMIRVYDMAGNCSEAAVGNFGFIIDNTPPVLAVDSKGAEGRWINGNVNFQISAEDAESGINRVEYSVDGQHAVHTGGQAFGVDAVKEAEDGNGYMIQVSAYNNAGLAAKYSGKILIDKTAPVISLSDITPQQVYQGQAVLKVGIKEAIYDYAQASVSAKRKLDGVEMQYATDAFTFSDVESFNSFAFTADGEYTVVVSAQDAAGNAAASQGITFSVDSTAPVIKLSGIQEGVYYREAPTLNLQVTESFYNTTNVKIQVHRQSGGETTEYELPEINLYAKESQGNYSFQEEGTYVVEVSAVDAAGNMAETKTISFVVDKTAPQIAVEGFEHHLVTDKKITAKFLVSDDYYQDLEVTAKVEKTDLEGRVTQSGVGIGAIAGRTTEAVKEFSEDGRYVLYLQAEDAAGNISKLEKEFTIDTQAPIIRYIEDYNGKYFQTFRLSYELEEMLYDFTLSEYLITLNGLPYDGVSEITEEGKYLLEILAWDEVGHEAKGKAEFIVDGTAPCIVFSGAEDGKASYQPVTLSISLKDEQDFIASLSVNSQKREIQENGQQSLQFGDFGKYEIEVLAEDFAGNITAERYTVIYKKESIFSKWYAPAAMGAAAVIGIGGVYGAISLKRKKIKGN